MITGTLLAIFSGFLYSITNIIDKFVVSKHIPKPIIMTIIISLFIGLVGLIYLPFTEIVAVGHLLILFISSCLSFAACLIYFEVIKYEEPSRIVPLFSFITIFITILGAIFLGEIFSLITYIGIGIILAGAWTISSKRNILSPFTSRFFGLMVLCSFLWAVNYVLLKYLVDQYPVSTIIAYDFIFHGAIAIVLLLFFYRSFIKFWQEKRKYVLIELISESISIFAYYFFLLAASLWYVSLASAVGTVQYLFVFLLAVILNKYRPGILDEQINRRIMIQKIIAIVLIIGGIFLISL
ncbi:MAG: DMT family transporter [Patescibacteria group bacterium]